MKKSIFESFPVTSEEYQELESKYGSLCHYAAWQLLKKNTRNNHTDEFEDIDQDMRAALLQAGSYHKRQVYIERCFKTANTYAKDVFVRAVLAELEDLWKNRTKHGANRQKFGPYQEAILWRIVKKVVPKGQRPSKKDKLVIDSKFPTYCKSIIWNTLKAKGKKITREKGIRSSLTSLSQFDFLGV